jgi:hypothetical protein
MLISSPPLLAAAINGHALRQPDREQAPRSSPLSANGKEIRVHQIELQNNRADAHSCRTVTLKLPVPGLHAYLYATDTVYITDPSGMPQAGSEAARKRLYVNWPFS